MDIAHCNTLEPTAKLLAELVAEVLLLIVAIPETTVHEPVPTVGGLALRFTLGDEIQIDCVDPAFETVGKLSTCTVMLDVLKQPPLLSRHCKTLFPTPKFVAELLKDPGVVIVPVPETTDQVPIPKVGALAARTVVGVLTQSVWLLPASAMPGTL